MTILPTHGHCVALPVMTLIFFCVLTVSSCRMPDDTRTTRDVPRVPGPEDRVNVAGWWYNGQQYLRLERDGRYYLYERDAVDDPPLHRGRWDLRSHDRISLEPYTEIDQEPFSVDILHDRDELTLRLPGYPEFRPSSAPDRSLRQTPRPPFEPDPIPNSSA